MEEANDHIRDGAHVLILPYPIQGHINPMLQFGKRLASKGLDVTLAITAFTAKSTPPQTGSVKIDTFSDGFDEGGVMQAGSIEAYEEGVNTAGRKTIRDLIARQQKQSLALSCLVYDAIIPWALDLAREFGLVGAAFFTQSCAVNSIYYHVQQGMLSVPITADGAISLPGLSSLEISDFPTFISKHGGGAFPSVLSLLLHQFSNLSDADCVLVNSCRELEPEVVEWMSKTWPIRTIGPTIPSAYLDNRVEGDNDYGLNLFNPNRATCIEWLNTKATGTVVYVSLGSVTILTAEQMEELAWGLKESNYYFLWVVRARQMSKLPNNFTEETTEKGLVVNWCPQLEVLRHPALGCFLTHCGWNSMLEALSLGVPMVALPQWSDQPTNAKYLRDVLKMGIRAGVDEKGMSTRTEIGNCLREIMEGEEGKKMKMSAETWKVLARKAVDEGGSSDKNIKSFVSNLRLKQTFN